MTDSIDFRPAILADLDEVVDFHVRCWRAAYAGMAPPEAIAALGYERRRPYWAAALGDPEAGRTTALAWRGDEIVGLAAFGAPSDPAFGRCGEVKHLFVDPETKRAGIGRRLLEIAFEGLRDAGFACAALASVKANHGAAAFYEALGGEVVGEFIDAGPMWRSENVIFRWRLPT